LILERIWIKKVNTTKLYCPGFRGCDDVNANIFDYCSIYSGRQTSKEIISNALEVLFRMRKVIPFPPPFESFKKLRNLYVCMM